MLTVIAGQLQASVINARSPAFADVSAAIGLAKEGDTVIIPAGEATWSQPLTISKGLTLQGQTVVSGGFSQWMADGSKSPLTYKPPVTRRTIVHGNVLLVPGGSSLYRVTGFTFLPPGQGNVINIKAGVPNFRVDHNEFQDAAAEQIWAFNDKGLIDHNVSDNSGQIFAHHQPYGWGGKPNSYSGDGSWAADADAGDAGGNAAKAENKVYLEDNFFRPKGTRGFIDGECGARLVARYNIIFSSCQNHGAEAAYHRSGRLAEIYGNTFFSREGVTIGAATFWRGGTGLIFNNNLTRTGQKDSYGSIGNVVDYRIDIVRAPAGKSWGRADGRNNWDLNQNGKFVRLLDQPGAGKDSAPLNGQRSSPRWPQQAIEPFYVWRNRLNGKQTDLGRQNYPFLQENKDYYNEAANFNGATGIGVGPVANRPANATDGVGYWATDQNTLYVRKGGAWIVYYRPFAYPHPLAGGNVPLPTPTPSATSTPTPSPAGSPNPPTNLRVVPGP